MNRDSVVPLVIRCTGSGADGATSCTAVTGLGITVGRGSMGLTLRALHTALASGGWGLVQGAATRGESGASLRAVGPVCPACIARVSTRTDARRLGATDILGRLA